MIMLRFKSFFRTLKVEEVYMFEYDSFEEVLQGITHFIEKVYNSKRLHSSLGHMPLEEFENKFNNNKIRTRQLVLTWISLCPAFGVHINTTTN